METVSYLFNYDNDINLQLPQNYESPGLILISENVSGSHQ